MKAHSIALLFALATLASCTSDPAPRPAPEPAPPGARTPEPPPPPPPARRFYLHVTLRSTDEAVPAFDPGSRDAIAEGLRAKGWLPVEPAVATDLDGIAASAADPLPALARMAPPDTRFILLAQSEVGYEDTRGPFTIWKARLHVRVYDVQAQAVVLSGTAEGTGTASNDRQAAIDADHLAGQAMGERLAGELK